VIEANRTPASMAIRGSPRNAVTLAPQEFLGSSVSPSVLASIRIAGISTARTPIPIGALVVADVVGPEEVNWSSSACSGRTDIRGEMNRA
jgi:hypothetical protein